MTTFELQSLEDAVVEHALLDGMELSVLRPRSSEALLDEEAFENEEFLPYWAELWPSALALARVLANRKLRGVRVLELGCGLGLPSLVAALRGARVLATDWSPDALVFARENARRNGGNLDTALLSWAEPEPLGTERSWQLILASDVLYERRNAELLLDLLPRLVVDDGEVLLSDPGRPHAASFLADAEAAWDVTTLRVEHQPRATVYSLSRRGAGTRLPRC